MNDKALGLLGIANKGGNIAIGEEPVGEAARAGKARLIILASNAADHTRRKATSFASLHGTPMIGAPWDKEVLGGAFGRNSVAMLTITDIFLAEHFLSALGDPERYAAQIQAVHEKAVSMKKRKQEKQLRKGSKRK